MTGKILSYSAGSSSRDPYKFRVIENVGPPTKLRRLIETFDELPRFFSDPSNSLLIDGYPAALGGLDSMTRVVTYLHPPTCTRALELAALEGWRSVFVAQPLAGAHLLLSALECGIQWPHELLWATGGYPLPASLENQIAEVLSDQNCRLSVLQAYGIAELDHTLLAATERDNEGRPIYHLIDEELTFEYGDAQRIAVPSSFVSLRYRGKTIPNQDGIEAVGSTYRLGGDPTRYGDTVLDWLESWQPGDWEHFTGYLAVDSAGDDHRLILQRRQHSSIAGRIGPIEHELSQVALNKIPTGLSLSEMNHFAFAEKYAMSWLEKPQWSDQAFRRLGNSAGLTEVAAAA